MEENKQNNKDNNIEYSWCYMLYSTMLIEPPMIIKSHIVDWFNGEKVSFPAS